jgi:hypothetical protein
LIFHNQALLQALLLRPALPRFEARRRWRIVCLKRAPQRVAVAAVLKYPSSRNKN